MVKTARAKFLVDVPWSLGRDWLCKIECMESPIRAHQDIFVGLVRLHVLYHASIEPIFGLGIVKELARHGYRLGPGTIYPLLRSMERRGWLKTKIRVVDGRRRILYSATRNGQMALEIGRVRVRELYEEMFAA